MYGVAVKETHINLAMWKKFKQTHTNKNKKNGYILSLKSASEQ